jgi:hypothetical protein
VEFVAFPIGQEGTTLTTILDDLAAAFSTVHPHMEQARDNKGTIDLATDHNDRIHEPNTLKVSLNSLTDLAQSRLLRIVSNRTRFVDALPREVSRRRSYSVASASPTPAARQEDTAK